MTVNDVIDDFERVEEMHEAVVLEAVQTKEAKGPTIIEIPFDISTISENEQNCIVPLLSAMEGTDAFIAGGYVASLLYKSEYNDIDIYCRSRTSFAQMTAHLLSQGYNIKTIYDQDTLKELVQNQQVDDCDSDCECESDSEDEDDIAVKKEIAEKARQGLAVDYNPITKISPSIEIVHKMKHMQSGREIDMMLINTHASPEEYVRRVFDMDGVMVVMNSNGTITTALSTGTIKRVRLTKLLKIINTTRKTQERVLKYLQKGFTFPSKTLFEYFPQFLVPPTVEQIMKKKKRCKHWQHPYGY